MISAPLIRTAKSAAHRRARPPSLPAGRSGLRSLSGHDVIGTRSGATLCIFTLHVVLNLSDLCCSHLLSVLASSFPTLCRSCCRNRLFFLSSDDCSPKNSPRTPPCLLQQRSPRLRNPTLVFIQTRSTNYGSPSLVHHWKKSRTGKR